MSKVAVSKITKTELWEFVAVTGYLYTMTNGYGQVEGRDPVVVSGQLLRVTCHAKTGWSELLIGPIPESLTVWVPAGTEIEVETA